MAITSSSSRQIETLIDALGASDVKREAAVARLIVIGARAVDRLIAFVDSTADAPARAATFRTLEAIADRRAIKPSVRAIADADQAVAVAAIAAARVFMRGPQGAAIVDAITAAALDPNRPGPIRVGALRALMDLERSTIAPLVKALADDPNAAVRDLATGGKAVPDSQRRRVHRDPADGSPPIDRTAGALEGSLPDHPQDLREIIVSCADTAPLAGLLRLIERIREREPSESPGRRPEWTRARGAAHLALANRGSRLAVYDLRESLEGATAPLPVEFLAALTLVGDGSCLEPIAIAYARPADLRRGRDDWWRQHLADAFREIARRAKVTRRHAVMKRIEKRWAVALEELWAGKAGGTDGPRGSSKSGGSGR